MGHKKPVFRFLAFQQKLAAQNPEMRYSSQGHEILIDGIQKRKQCLANEPPSAIPKQ